MVYTPPSQVLWTLVSHSQALLSSCTKNRQKGITVWQWCTILTRTVSRDHQPSPTGPQTTCQIVIAASTDTSWEKKPKTCLHACLLPTSMAFFSSCATGHGNHPDGATLLLFPFSWHANWRLWHHSHTEKPFCFFHSMVKEVLTSAQDQSNLCN